MDAARVVGARSRPLLVFYALSQGGRAVVAARGDEPRAFGHGLGEVVEDDSGGHLLHRRIERCRGGLFGAVSRALDAPDFTGEVELGALWVAHPSLWRLPLDVWKPEWRMALHADETQSDQAPHGFKAVRIMPFTEPLAAVADHGPELRGPRYPTVPADLDVVWKPPGERGHWAAWVHVPDDDLYSARVDAIAPRSPYGEAGLRYVTTALAGHSDPLRPCQLWWLLLFGLSIFAR